MHVITHFDTSMIHEESKTSDINHQLTKIELLLQSQTETMFNINKLKAAVS